MNVRLPPPTGLTQEEWNRQMLEAVAKLAREVEAMRARLAAAGVP